MVDPDPMSTLKRYRLDSGRKRSFDQEEVARAILAALILVGIAATAIVWSIINPEGPKGAVALDISVPQTTLSGAQEEILVVAVNASGEIDPTRNDTVRISIECDAAMIRSQSGLNREWCKEVTLNLNQGVGRVDFLAPKRESITVTATWLQGQSPLQSNTVIFYSSRFRPETPEPPPR